MEQRPFNIRPRRGSTIGKKLGALRIACWSQGKTKEDRRRTASDSAATQERKGKGSAILQSQGGEQEQPRDKRLTRQGQGSRAASQQKGQKNCVDVGITRRITRKRGVQRQETGST